MLSKDLNQIEEAILRKIQERVHSRSTEETFLAKALRSHSGLTVGWLDLPKFSRALQPYTSGVSDKDVAAIFERYADQGSLPIRPFASEFVSGARREAMQAPEPVFQDHPMDDQNQEMHIQSIQDVLYDQGPRGITSLAAAIRDADPQNTRMISFDTFEMVMQDFLQDAPEVDIAAVFDMFKQPASTEMPYDEFFLALKEEPSAARRAAIRQAFRRLDTASEGVVDLTLILRSFNANRHPQVAVGTRNASEVLEEFAESLKDHISFRRGQRSYPTNLVAWEEFDDYYKSISGCYESDEEFCGILEKVWDLNKAPDASVEGRAALARPAAGARGDKIREGLHHWQAATLPASITHHKVESLTKAEDVLARARQVIARKGLRTAVDIIQRFYAADDDVDDELDMYEFRQACRQAGLTFREAEEVSVFDACAARKGKLHLPSFLKLLFGEMSPARRSLVEKAFAAVGGNPQDDQSVVSGAALKEHFLAQAHPLVVRGQLEPGYVLAEFLDTFSQLVHVLGASQNGMVSFHDFSAYYDIVSSTVENDSLFDLIVQRVWDVKTKAWDGEEVSPRRLLREVDDAPSPTARKRPPQHTGPSAYTMDSPRGPQEHHRRFGRGPQASAITKSSIVFSDNVNTLQEVFKRLSRSISLRGLRGWLTVVQRFQHFDYRRNGTIMRLDWQRLNKSLGLGLSSEDQELIFKELAQRKKGQAMDYVECLRILRGNSLPQDRAQAVQHLFEALGKGDAISPHDLKSRFDASSAPQCLLRRKDPRQAEQEFFDAVDFFSQGAPFDVEKFDEFFRMVSAVHEDDDEFRLMTTSAFDVH